MQYKTYWMLLILSSTLAACSTSLSHLSPFDLSSGKRQAWVTKLYTPDISREALPPCLQPLPKKVLEQQHFAEVGYRSAHETQHAVIAIPEGESLQLGDEVEIAPESCTVGQLAQVTRLLSSKTQK